MKDTMLYAKLPTKLIGLAWEFDDKFLDKLSDDYVDAHKSLAVLLMKAYKLGRDDSEKR